MLLQFAVLKTNNGVILDGDTYYSRDGAVIEDMTRNTSSTRKFTNERYEYDYDYNDPEHI